VKGIIKKEEGKRNKIPHIDRNRVFQIKERLNKDSYDVKKLADVYNVSVNIIRNV
jgi:hypothetical protein